MTLTGSGMLLTLRHYIGFLSYAVDVLRYVALNVVNLRPLVVIHWSFQPAFPCRLIRAFVIRFLAHLSRRLMGELIVYQSLRRPSVVRPSVRLSVRPSVNIFKHLLL